MRMFWIVTYILSHTVPLLVCDECSILRCPDPIRTIPECDNTKIIDCVRDVFTACPTGVQYGQLLKANELTRKAICKNEELHKNMKKHSECWFYAFKCAASLSVISGDHDDAECNIHKEKVENCKNVQGLPIACIDIHESFLDLVFETTTCDGATVAVKISVLIVSFIIFLCIYTL